jgi:hypothetical protein
LTKAFDTATSRGQIDSAKGEAAEIRNRVNQLEADLFETVVLRAKELYSATIHLQESLETLKEARGLRGRG